MILQIKAYFKPYYQLISFHTCCIYCLPIMTFTIDGLYFPLCSSYPAVYPIAMSGKNDTQPPSWAPFFVFLLIKSAIRYVKKRRKREMYQKSQVNWDSRSRVSDISPLKNFPEKKHVFYIN